MEKLKIISSDDTKTAPPAPLRRNKRKMDWVDVQTPMEDISLLQSKLSGLWASSAQIKERYVRLRDRDTDTNIKFETELSKLNDLMVKHYVHNAPLGLDFRTTLHAIYKLLLNDENNTFALFQHDVLLLLARVDISTLPHTCTSDFLGVFELLLAVITKRYDEYSDEFEEVTKRTSKIMGVFLISCLDYKLLSLEKVAHVAALVLRLTQYYLTLTELMSNWFTYASKEPDVIYLFYERKLPLNCFPIFDLARDFLFMDDGLSQYGKDTFLHIVSISAVCEPLELWIVESDLPDLIFTGLLLNFNQSCYSESLCNGQSDTQLLDNESFKEFDQYITFVLSLLSRSARESIRFLFLRSLSTNFFLPLIECYNTKSPYYSNMLMLLSHTLESIMLPHVKYDLIGSFADDFINESLNSFILDLFTLPLDLKEPRLVLILLRFLSVFARIQNHKVLSIMFVETGDCWFHSPIVISSMVDMVKQLHEDEKTRIATIDVIQQSAKILKAYKLQGTPLKFDDKTAVYSTLCQMLYNFFSNDSLINEALMKAIIDIIHANGGYNTGLFLQNTLLDNIYEYLWGSYSDYDKQISHGKKLLRLHAPPGDLIRCMEELGVRHNELPKSLQVTEQLIDNLILFKRITIDLFATYQAVLMIHGAVY